jgi:hypothetical protein
MQGDLGLPPPVPARPGGPRMAELQPAPPAPEVNAQDTAGPDDADDTAPSEADRKIAALRGAPLPEPRGNARRDLLPDIEEINSTLKPAKAPAAAAAPAPAGAARASGFRSGFSLMLLAAMILVALYVMAPQIAQQIPGAAPAMESYVAMVNDARVALDGLIRSATALLRGLTEGQPPA